ncbi:hypothetical protein LFT51_05425 [Mycobacterium intracellulare subsp. chimaera]|uniref:Core-binding (CB) domain-containing protein n=5 Tax=Mycobacterium TaxID=1763 RepID=D5PE45_9MYCO|nr:MULTISPECIES: hypothetical protein [Mycobacteriaceae]ASL07750.1 site-specific recombinase XerD [Mycobacterium intracellulare subsp. chimaera]ASL13404.1 site-specific recombinase XerD [Mycobacterium intracellulare subsp. chimaera]ASL19539.1 site-specific recombinase XerD [Mycobacterium intracellulare subsp. chimaera]EFG75654.1 hypothetical protein HMPREF0591_4439 [Mycobacterium parascrofulaceum ATCC BAA-614]MDM3909396.1 hypothetical protein [Mycobacterium intracellulare subsp. chimaera]
MALAVVRDLREHRVPASEEELADFETDVLAGFVLARASAGLVDSTIRNDINHLELIHDWFGRPLWEMRPADVDVYFGKVLRDANPSTRTGRAAALTVYFQFLELRHKIDLHNMTGRVVECPLDEINRPRASVDPQLRIPPTADEVEQLFAGWRQELAGFNRSLQHLDSSEVCGGVWEAAVGGSCVSGADALPGAAVGGLAAGQGPVLGGDRCRSDDRGRRYRSGRVFAGRVPLVPPCWRRESTLARNCFGLLPILE